MINTRFDKDMQLVKSGDLAEIRDMLLKRATEISSLKEKVLGTKNKFIATCALQDMKRLRAEYEELDAAI